MFCVEPVEICPGGMQIRFRSSAFQIIVWLAGMRECPTSPLFPSSSPVLAFLHSSLHCFTHKLELICFSSCSLHRGYLTRNSSCDPSVSVLSSAKGKTPSTPAHVGGNRVGFAER